MASFNKIIIVGYLGRDPELRYTPSGTPVCDFSIATSERKKGKDAGEGEEVTTWGCGSPSGGGGRERGGVCVAALGGGAGGGGGHPNTRRGEGGSGRAPPRPPPRGDAKP